MVIFFLGYLLQTFLPEHFPPCTFPLILTFFSGQSVHGCPLLAFPAYQPPLEQFAPDVTYVASIIDDDGGAMAMCHRVVCLSVSCAIVSITLNAVASLHPEVSCSRLPYLCVVIITCQVC